MIENTATIVAVVWRVAVAALAVVARVKLDRLSFRGHRRRAR